MDYDTRREDRIGIQLPIVTLNRDLLVDLYFRFSTSIMTTIFDLEATWFSFESRLRRTAE